MRCSPLVVAAILSSGCGAEAPAPKADTPPDSGAGGPDPGGDAGGTGEGDGGPAGDGGGDTAPPSDSAAPDSGAPGGDPFATTRCPAGMVAVPTDAPLFCIDRYEVNVVGGVAVSEAGVVPSTSVSFLGARAACEATPVLDASGVERGRKRLVRSQEWVDANDGVVGPGGTRLPYGDAWEDRRCAAPDRDGTVWLTAAVPAGALPGCVSPFGVADAVGNMWEWMDPEVNTDSAAALARFAAAGVHLWAEEDGGLRVLEGDVRALRLQVITAPGGLTAREGLLFVESDPLVGDLRGYLALDGEGPSAGWASVALRAAEGGYFVALDPDADGLPVPDKRGCAWYFGSSGDGGCDLGAATYFHTATFEGSISFRCAADPLP